MSTVIEKDFSMTTTPSHVAYWIAPALVGLTMLLAVRAYLVGLRTRPKLRPEEILFEEHFVSGASLRNPLTRCCTANNCLRLVVTKEILWITSWFPAAMFTALFDLEKVISLERIMSVETTQFFGRSQLVLNYVDAGGVKRGVRLATRKREAFLQVVGKALPG